MFRIFIISMVGLGIETFWTGIYKMDQNMIGYSSAWYVLFYGSSPMITAAIIKRCDYVLIRMFIYAMIIFACEFFGMAGLWMIFGQYPTLSVYQTRPWNVYGFSDIMNFPEFMILGFLIEKTNVYLSLRSPIKSIGKNIQTV